MFVILEFSSRDSSGRDELRSDDWKQRKGSRESGIFSSPVLKVIDISDLLLLYPVPCAFITQLTDKMKVFIFFDIHSQQEYIYDEDDYRN